MADAESHPIPYGGSSKNANLEAVASVVSTPTPVVDDRTLLTSSLRTQTECVVVSSGKLTMTFPAVLRNTKRATKTLYRMERAGVVGSTYSTLKKKSTLSSFPPSSAHISKILTKFEYCEPVRRKQWRSIGSSTLQSHHHPLVTATRGYGNINIPHQ